MQITLRKAHESEVQQLSEIAYLAKKHWGYSEQWMALWEDGLVIAPEFITNNNVWVATESKKIVGFAVICIENSMAELEHLWVEPNHMRKGIGERLFKNILDYCRLNGIEKLRIESDPNAQAFYEKMGAELVAYVDSVPKPKKLPVLEIEP